MKLRAARLTRVLGRRARRAQGRLLGTLTRVSTGQPVVALTFDDGPHPEYTPRLLEVLRRHGARGTFFMIGLNARRHPRLVEEVARAGHAICNHSWDHPTFPTLSPRARREQLRRCAAALAPYEQPFFRPPKTLQTVGSWVTARRAGYEVVAWNVEVEDWRPHDADRIAARLLERIRPGSIVVLHDAIWDPKEKAAKNRSHLVEAVDTVLSELKARFRFVTVPELMRLGRPVREPWFVRSDRDW